MGTIYLSQAGIKVNKKGGQIIISLQGQELQRVPELYVEHIVVMSAAQITYAVLTSLLERGGSVTYMSFKGHMQGILGADKQQGALVLEQARAHLDAAKRTEVAREIVQSKLTAQRQLLQSYNKSLNSDIIKSVIAHLARYKKAAGTAGGVNKLLGIEGMAAKEYYDCFPILLKNEDFYWQGRNRRPPRDPVNALLSFAYTMLTREVRLAAMQSGLHMGIGFLHGVNNYKEGLVYDVMEPFRAMAAERFVFNCINRRLIGSDEFDFAEPGCYLQAEARKKFINAFECFKNEKSFNGRSLHEAIRQELLTLKKSFKEAKEEIN